MAMVKLTGTAFKLSVANALKKGWQNIHLTRVLTIKVAKSPSPHTKYLAAVLRITRVTPTNTTFIPHTAAMRIEDPSYQPLHRSAEDKQGVTTSIVHQPLCSRADKRWWYITIPHKLPQSSADDENSDIPSPRSSADNKKWYYLYTQQPHHRNTDDDENVTSSPSHNSLATMIIQ